DQRDGETEPRRDEEKYQRAQNRRCQESRQRHGVQERLKLLHAVNSRRVEASGSSPSLQKSRKGPALRSPGNRLASATGAPASSPSGPMALPGSTPAGASPDRRNP